jgi:hypothetical protein
MHIYRVHVLKKKKPSESPETEPHSTINTNHTSDIHINVLSVLTEQTRYTETKDWSAFRDLPHKNFMQRM